MTGLTQSTPSYNGFPRWFWFWLTVTLGVLSFGLFILNLNTPVPVSWGITDGLRNHLNNLFDAFQQSLLSPLIMSVFGTLILRRHPRHRIGALLVLLGFVTALGQLTQEWAVYAYFTQRQALPGAAVAAWVTNWIWLVLFSVLLLIAGLFPNGRFASLRWRWWVGLPLLLFALPMFTAAMFEREMSSAFQIHNPLSVTLADEWYAALFNFGVIFMPVTAIMVFLSAIVRFRRSRFQERQQMKWLLVGVAFMALFTLLGLGLNFGLNNPIGAYLVNAAMLGPAIGVGVALVRHRLYEVDILIRRTLQYSVLSGLLGLTYFGLVVVLQSLASVFGGQRSEFVTVLSTLAIAALFFPLRNRVQEFIDKRFYRKKYDAQKVLAEFAATCRDETDINSLTARLVEVVQETMQPESLSVRLKSAEPLKRRES